MNGPLVSLAVLPFAAWIYLAFFHGRFWRADQRLDEVEASGPAASAQPAVTAVVPARNEADIIERSIGSLLDQEYSGEFRIILVDDHSEDATGDVARRMAEGHPCGDRLTVIRSEAMPPGWVGKMWAVHTGVAAAQRSPDVDYLLLTDADVAHDSGNLARLVSKAEKSKLDLVSLMVLLHCKSAWERLLIPSFVYFFQKLYPFPRINDPRSRATGAAGGCLLVRSDALKRAGGIESVRGAIIDDCALGAAIKRGGPVWVGVTDREYSFRPYRGLRDIWAMVARSAYTQLQYSVALLVGTVVGLVLIYLLPPLLLISWPFHGNAAAGLLGAATWALMAWTFLPTLRLYRLGPLRALALPAAAALYLCMTVDSARLHWLGRGAYWKGRAGAGRTETSPQSGDPAR
jgi:hopene-associated glycosyltransferase HpnB